MGILTWAPNVFIIIPFGSFVDIDHGHVTVERLFLKNPIREPESRESSLTQRFSTQLEVTRAWGYNNRLCKYQRDTSTNGTRPSPELELLNTGLGANSVSCPLAPSPSTSLPAPPSICSPPPPLSPSGLFSPRFRHAFRAWNVRLAVAFENGGKVYRLSSTWNPVLSHTANISSAFLTWTWLPTRTVRDTQSHE